MIRHFLIEPYQIPNSAMKPTVLPGDVIFVWKWPFYSQPLSPTLARGDIVVFSCEPAPTSTPLQAIRRIVGLPGDQIEMNQGHLSINQQALPWSPIPPVPQQKTACFRETLPGGRSFSACTDLEAPLSFPAQTVPQNHFFVAGDFRSDILAKSPTYCPLAARDTIRGKPWMVWLSIDPLNTVQGSNWFPQLRRERIFQKIE
jgi:signal peptidase I